MSHHNKFKNDKKHLKNNVYYNENESINSIKSSSETDDYDKRKKGFFSKNKHSETQNNDGFFFKLINFLISLRRHH
ncbi:hypothetical protein GCL60_12905 [Silvanigrella paludirubra]|uniref:Uncharacterized protein n=1 Tax=Silvanigrella paludirubra TaxID=2499159 RepID=A0A6N6VTP3_9BACT|nr:hypothetical protein [Silvanigrella paludirubra]KAB8038066.1 hypothetical protein GCL60_12905 [Silvanigrella paludirubra]